MAKVIIDEETLTDIGDAIREKEGSAELIPTSEMGDRIRAITGGSGSSDMEDAILTGTVTTYYNDRITSLRYGAFYSYGTLTDITLPNVTKLSGYTFVQCSSLVNISLPNCTTLGNYDFEHCKALEHITLPKVNGIGHTFDGCESLKTARLPVADFIGGYSFYKCSMLTDVYLGYQGVVSLLSNLNVFSTTGIKIHVRSAYASSYASASNWKGLISNGTVVIVGDYTD